jgi:hypothetical protein
VRRSLSLAAAAAVLLGTGGVARASDELPNYDTALVQVFVKSQADVDKLSATYDLAEYKRVEKDGTIVLNIDTTPAERSELRALGYGIGRTIEDGDTRTAVAEERDALKAEQDLAADLALNGVPKGGVKLEGKTIVPVRGETVIQRADRFTNYAGTFLYVEAHNKANTNTAGPTQSLSFAGPDGVYVPASPATMIKFTDAGQYIFHRQLIRLTAAQAAIPVAQLTVRVASASGATDTSSVKEWLGTALPPNVADYKTGFFNRYQDPTENRAQLDALAAEFPNLVTPVNLPNLTAGYQRKSQAILAGTTAIGTAPAAALQGSAINLTTKEWGHLGGDNVTAEIVTATAANAPLAVAVTGTDIKVTLGTGADGAATSTAAQVVAAINASPAASALVFAQTYRGNAGAGVMQPRAKVNLDDFLNAPASVQRGPFQQRIYRIGAVRDGSKVGVFIYCQQHAREWTTGLTCVETAQRLVRNYATDPETKKLLDNVEVFVLANVNPDGGHYSMYDFASQRKNLTNYCPVTGNSDAAGRTSWGVDLNRNSGEYSAFDGYDGASTTSCTSGTFAGPAEYSEPEIKNEKWVADTYGNIKFAVNVHSYGGYFMWAPGSYIANGRITSPAPNIGVEQYFFEAGEKILRRIKDYRGTVILPERTGPIADVLYSAAGNSADDQWYRKGIISYSFETGADRFTSTSSGIAQIETGFQPCFGAVGTGGGAGSCPTSGALVNEGRDQAMEFASGNFGLVESAYDYAMDTTAPKVSIDYSAVDGGGPISYRFNWDTEAATIYYTTDGSTPTKQSKTYNAERPRGLGEILTLTGQGEHFVKWMAVDIKGNQSAVQTQRFLVGANEETGTVGGSVPATLALTVGQPAFGAFTAGIARDYLATTTATVTSSAGDAALIVQDTSPFYTNRLVNGSFALAQELQVKNNAGAYQTMPAGIRFWGGPTAAQAVPVEFKQSIGANEPLRSGSYSKTLTFTLSTTTP